MANVIDSLIVTLGLDTKGYVKGQKEAEKTNKALATTQKRDARQRRTLEEKEFRERRKRHQVYNRQAKETIEHYRKIRHEMLATLGISASIGGMLMFARSAITGAANMSVMSGNLGLGVRQIAGYRGALEALGGSASDANGLLSAVNNTIGEYDLRGNTTGLMSAFLGLGGSLPNGSKTTVPQFMRAMADLVQRGYRQSPAQGEAVARELGLSSPAMIALMRRGGAGMQAMVSRQAALSGITGRTAAQAQRFRQAMVTLGHTLSGIGRSLVLSLMPNLLKFEHKLQELGSWVRSHGPEINHWLDTAADTIGGVAMDINKIAKAMGGWKVVIAGLAGIKAMQWLVPVAKAFVGLSAVAGGPITAAVAAITALIGSLMYFYHTNSRFRHIANQLGSDAKGIIEAFIPGTAANKSLISSTRKAGSDEINAVKSLFSGPTHGSGAPVHWQGDVPRPFASNSSAHYITMGNVHLQVSKHKFDQLHGALSDIFGSAPFLPDANWGEQ